MIYADRIVEKYDADFDSKECCKCGSLPSWKLQYIECDNVLYVSCKECWYVYHMEPKNP